MKNKNYSVSSIFGSLLSADEIVKARNSKLALEKVLDKKLGKNKLVAVRNRDVQFSVVECDELGRLHYDRRRWLYYGLRKG